MKCTKTMIKIGAAILAVVAIAYIALPQYHALIFSAAPYLLFLLCPLSMMFMMKGMSAHQGGQPSASDVPQNRSPEEEPRPGQ